MVSVKVLDYLVISLCFKVEQNDEPDACKMKNMCMRSEVLEKKKERKKILISEKCRLCFTARSELILDSGIRFS